MLAIYRPDRKLAAIGDCRALPADPVPNKSAGQGRQPIGLPSLRKAEALSYPAVRTHPAPPRTIASQGPTVLPGRLGTLVGGRTIDVDCGIQVRYGMTDIFPDTVSPIVLIFLLQGKMRKLKISLAMQGANISLNPSIIL